MLREQMINVLQSAVVFLVLTNIASLIAAYFAVRFATQAKPATGQPSSVLERNLQAILRRAS
jgi:hypothetical protein